MLPNKVGWHDARRARIRYAHPEVRELYGPDGRTQLAALGVVGAHFFVARALRGAALGPWLGATLVVGPTLAHALGVLIHEATHNLVAKGTRANKAWGLFLNLPLGAPAAVDFRAQHLLHHRHLGEVDPATGQDTQAPTTPEDDWVGSSTFRKLLSFTAGRFYWKGRPSGEVPFDAWKVANWVTSFGAIGLVGATWGAAPALYLLTSSLLAFGPHTFGARRLSEHLPVRDEQPTNSYYGPLNLVSFNVGYHVEHHDFPNIAWTRVKRLRELASEEYDSLFAFHSWTRLILDYFVDERYRVRHYVGLGEPLGEAAVASGSGSAGEGFHAPGGSSSRVEEEGACDEPTEACPRTESGFFESRDSGKNSPHAA
jgi:sphingolipid 4-desaturase/C4-monooxygenase